MTETYTCSNCKGTFEKGWSDEAAATELTESFGSGYAPSDCEIVCDDCYNKIMGWAKTEAGSAALAETLVEGLAERRR